jgi:hypothetical protein
MLLLSALFLAGLVTPVIDAQLSSGWRHVIAVGNTGIWAIFLVEYITRFARDRRAALGFLQVCQDEVAAPRSLRPCSA